MAAWDADYPGDHLDADTLHTIMQTVKARISERMVALSSDSTIDEHNVCQSGEDGLHPMSKVGFLKIHATYSAFAAWFATASNKVAGSLHYCSDTELVYLIDEELNIKAATLKDHSLLQDLLDISCHTDLFARNGSRAMQGDWHFANDKGIENAVYGSSADDDALDPAHVDQDWYTAHGADMLQERHWPGGVLNQAMLRFERKNISEAGGEKHYLEDATLDIFSMVFPTVQDPVIVGQYWGRDGTGWYMQWLADEGPGRTHVWYGASG